MALKDWDDIPYIAGDCVRDHNEWNDMVDYIRHSACTDFVIYSVCPSTGQAFKFSQTGILSQMYGGADTGDDLSIYANSTDDSSYIKLFGDGNIHLRSELQVDIFKAANLMFRLARIGTLSSFYGGSVSGDDLSIYANTSNTYPSILFEGNEGINLNVNNDEEIMFTEAGATFLEFDNASATGTAKIYGNETNTGDLQLFGNSSGDNSPFVLLTGRGDIQLDSYVDVSFSERGHEMFRMRWDGSSTCTLYGADATGDDMEIVANSVDLCASIKLFGNGDITNKIKAASVFEISTCSDETLFEVDNDHVDFHCFDAHNFVLELRTTNPSSPTCTGQIWFRTDLV